MGLLILGLLASLLIAFSQIPQLFQIIKSKDTAALSLPTYIVLASGCILWLIYGLILGDIPMIICNSTTLIITLTILSYKLKYR